MLSFRYTKQTRKNVADTTFKELRKYFYTFPCREMHDLPKICKRYSHDLSKASKVSVSETFDLSKVREITRITSPKLGK